MGLKTDEGEAGSMWSLEGYIEDLIKGFRLITEQIVKFKESRIVLPNQYGK